MMNASYYVCPICYSDKIMSNIDMHVVTDEIRYVITCTNCNHTYYLERIDDIDKDSILRNRFLKYKDKDFTNVLIDWDGTIMNQIKFKTFSDVLCHTLFTGKYIINRENLLNNILKDPDKFIVTLRPKCSTFLVRLRLLKDFWSELTWKERLHILLGNKVISSNKFFFFTETGVREMAKECAFIGSIQLQKLSEFENKTGLGDRSFVYVDSDDSVYYTFEEKNYD